MQRDQDATIILSTHQYCLENLVLQQEKVKKKIEYAFLKQTDHSF